MILPSEANLKSEADQATTKEKQTVAREDHWSMSPANVFEALKTSDRGLSEQEVQRRLKTYGHNELPSQALSWLQIFFRQLRNPIFIILIACAVIAGFFAEVKQSVIILSMIALSVILGFFNEYRAEKIVVNLRRNVSIKAVVTRDGKPCEIDSRDLVPGDLVSVYVGDIVPADLRIVECKDLQSNESVLTGESFPIEKTSESLDLQRPTPQQLTNYQFMGTVIVNGSGRGIVVSTGGNTEFGAISRSLTRPHPETEFQKGVRKYGNMLLTLTLALAIGIFGLNAIKGRSIIDALLFALAVAIGLVPELMPAIVTISLSQGAQRMAKVRVVVKRLVSIEDFGNMDVLCTDKTGTLTEGRITLKDYESIDEKNDPRILTYAMLCNAAVVGDKISGNPMDIAIWQYATDKSVQGSVKNYAKVDEIPFDYRRRMMSVVAHNKGGFIFVTKGAPESVLSRCAHVEMQGKREPIDESLHLSINDKFLNLSHLGYRLIAVAYKNVDERATYSVEDEKDLTLLGFLTFSDPPKADAQHAVAKLNEMGVDVKILTGDNELVARKICDDLNVQVKRVIGGSELDEMSATEVRAAAEEATIFARITPEQKLDIIKALKANEHVIGFMGDGVNDAPALYEADVGLSVDTAVDVSKDAADIVLLDKDLLVLANGITEGRKIFGNTMKYVLMGTSSNFGNMLSVAVASIFLPFLPMLPMQILFMNLLYDVANMTLPTDNVDEEYTKLPKRWDIGFVRKYTLFFGPFSSLYDFLTYGIMLFIFGTSVAANLSPQSAEFMGAAALFQSGWFVESFWTEVFVMFVIRTRRIPFLTSRPGKWLTMLTLSCIAFGTLLPFTVLGDFLGFTALPPEYWVLLILMVATYLLLVDAGKVFFYKICRF